MSTVLSVLAAFVLICVLVTVHEFGHYYVGKKLGFTILEFAVGMGPVIYKKNRNGIDYSIRLLPIGGMCQFYGEDEGIADGKSFNAHAAWKRFLVIAAGPLMNLLFALLISVVTLSVYGNYMPSVMEIASESPAEKGGLLPGDLILSVDGRDLHDYNDAVPYIQGAETKDLSMTVERDGSLKELVLPDIYDAAQGKNYIGVTITAERMQFGFLKSISESFHYTGSVIGQIFDFFGTLFRGQASSSDVSGPVGTIAYISQAVRYGFEMILRFTIMISISLGIFNLLPIPALDGGRLVFLLFELITGKQVDPEKEGMIHFVGLLLLFGLIIFLTFNDVKMLIG